MSAIVLSMSKIVKHFNEIQHLLSMYHLSISIQKDSDIKMKHACAYVCYVLQQWKKPTKTLYHEMEA